MVFPVRQQSNNLINRTKKGKDEGISIASLKKSENVATMRTLLWQVNSLH